MNVKNSELKTIWCNKYEMSVSQINIDTNFCMNIIGRSKTCLQSCKSIKNCVQKLSSNN